MDTFYKDMNITYKDSKLQEYNDKYYPDYYSGPAFLKGEYSDILGKATMGFAVGLSYTIF